MKLTLEAARERKKKGNTEDLWAINILDLKHEDWPVPSISMTTYTDKFSLDPKPIIPLAAPARDSELRPTEFTRQRSDVTITFVTLPIEKIKQDNQHLLFPFGIPVNVTEAMPDADHLYDPNFVHAVEQGVIRLLTQSVAKAVMDSPEVKDAVVRSLVNIASAIHAYQERKFWEKTILGEVY